LTNDEANLETQLRPRTPFQIWAPIIAVLAIVALVFAAAGYAIAHGLQAHDISIIAFVAFGTIVVLFAATVLYKIGTGGISLAGLISEPEGEHGLRWDRKPKASLSRFQFLIFTFVIAGLFLMLSIEAGQFVDIPNNVLVLIGLSGTGYATGKVLSGDPNTPRDTDPQSSDEVRKQ